MQGRLAVVLYFLNLYNDSSFYVFGKDVVSAADAVKIDITEFWLKCLFRFYLVRFYLNTLNIFDKSLENDFVSKGFFKENFVI